MCAIHREGMSGKIVVVPSGTQVASPSAQYAGGQKALQATEAKLATADAALKQGKPPLPIAVPGQNHVLAGSGNPAVQDAFISQFGPQTVHIPVGGSVTWWFLGGHSITFNSDKSDNDVRAVAPDGSVHLNPKAVGAVNTPGEPPSKGGGGPGASNAPPTFKVVAAKSWNGQGFLNTGVFLNSGPPKIEGYKLTFTKAGTYHYICTVHDDMKGTVVVR
jgi:plastocyanin